MIKRPFQRIKQDATQFQVIARNCDSAPAGTLLKAVLDDKELFSRYISLCQAALKAVENELGSADNDYARLELQILYSIVTVDVLFGEHPDLLTKLALEKTEAMGQMLEEVMNAGH